MFQDLRQPDFERLRKTLFNKKADAVPLIELGIHPIIKEKIIKRPLNSLQDEVNFMRSMGYDYIKIQPVIDLRLGRKAATESGAIDRTWASEHSGVITNWEEFEKYNWPRKENIDYSNLENARNLLPEEMGIIGQYGDIFTSVWEMMGFETFAMAMFEQPDLVEALFEKVGGLILSMFDNMSDMDWVGALWYSDDIAYSSGLMVSPDFLRTHFFPILRHIGDLCQKRSIPFIYHTDGKLWDVLDDIINCGVTALHPIEPKSMDIYELDQKYGSKLCFCGGIEVDLLARGKEFEIKDLVNKYLRDIAVRGGYCIGSSNSIPEYVSLKNYFAMVETILKNGNI